MASINVQLTGGTSPGEPRHTEQLAKGKSPGAGKVPRYYNKASGKMETAGAMKAYRNPRVSAASRAMGAPRAHAPAPAQRAPQQAQKSTPYVHALGTTFGFPAAKGRGIENLINASQGAERGTVLAPYQQKGREIGNTEQTVSDRVGAFNQQAQNAFTGLVGQQEASAKTFENQAAETALQSQKGIETAGQNAITSSGGYLDPQLRAQIAASQAEITGLGQAATTRANEQGQAQTAYMRQLQAANVQRGVEGQKEIGNIYGAERGRNTAAENQALGRLEAKAKAERITIPKELLTQELVQRKLQQQGELGQEKIAVGAQKNAVTARGQNLTRAGRAETNAAGRERNAVGRERNAVTARGQNLTRQSAAERNQIAREGHQKTYEAAVKRIQTKLESGTGSGGKPLSRQGRNSLLRELGGAFQAFMQLRPQGKTTAEIRQDLARGLSEFAGSKGKAEKVKIDKVSNPVLLKAAEEVYIYHYLNPQTRAELARIGGPSNNVSNLLLK